jgi:hypothetical protein
MGRRFNLRFVDNRRLSWPSRTEYLENRLSNLESAQNSSAIALICYDRRRTRGQKMRQQHGKSYSDLFLSFRMQGEAP